MGAAEDIEQRFAAASQRFQARDAAGAEALLLSVLADAPDHARALALLGLIAGRAGREDDCVALLARSMVCGTPAEAAAAGLWLAAAHRRAGRREDEIAVLEQALALNPLSDAARGALAAALNAQGLALKDAGDLTAAGARLERSVALAPQAAEPRFNLAAIRKEEGRTDDAVTLLRAVVAAAPDLAEGRFALAMAHLPVVSADMADSIRARAAYAAELAALEAYAADAGTAALAPGVGAAQPFQLAYLGGVETDLARRYGDLVCRAMTAACPAAPLAPPPNGGERLRIGIVCGHIRDHSVWRLPTRGWVEGLDPARFELIAFHTGAARDAETARAEPRFAHFVQGPLPFDAWREAIVATRPHALIYPEIGMDPMCARLAALRLAGVQYAAWGHPVTTGYPTIDHYLSSEAMEPSGAAAHYTERLVRLPGLGARFDLPPLGASVPTRASLGLPDDAALFWCCQTLSKYLPEHDHVFADIAAEVPASCFVFFAYPGSPPLTARFQARLAAAFAARGLDAARHCAFLPRMTAPAFRAAMGCADVFLDSLGWSACNSLLDALAHPLPVVTAPGDTMRSRHAAAVLAELGLAEMVSADKAAYIAAAIALARDPQRRHAARSAIRAALPRLNRTSAVPALAAHLVASVTGGRTS